MRHVVKPQTTWLVIIIFSAIGLLYLLNNPVFESPDERSHFLYIHDLLTTGELPILEDRETVFASGAAQRHHPPLYYLLGALLISGTERLDLPAYSIANPYGVTGTIRSNNLNVMLHPLNPTGDTALAVAILRLYSLVLGVGTLLLVYRTARRAFTTPGIAPLAMALTAFIPMFGYIHTSITNDSLITFLCATAVCWLVTIWQTKRLRPRDSLILGFIAAGIALTKMNGLPVLGVVGLWLLIGAAQGRWPWRVIVRTGAIAGVMVAALAGWWYMRNVQLYGDLIAWNATQAIWGRGGWPDAKVAVSEAQGVWESFWLILGYFSIRGPALAYPLLTLFAAIGAAGALLPAINESNGREPFLLLMSVVAATIAGLIVGTRSVNISQGRILFPMLTAFAPLLMSGWWFWLRRWAWLPLVPMALLAFYAPVVILPAAYPAPQRVNALDGNASPLQARAETIELLGYTLDRDSMSPDETLRITLVLRGGHAADPLLLIRLLDPLTDVPVATADLYAGMVKTSEFDPAALYRFEVALWIDRVLLTGTEPRRLDLLLGWRIPQGDFTLGQGELIDWVIPGGTTSIPMLRVPGPTLIDPDYGLPDPPNRVDATFGEGIGLTGYALSPDPAVVGEALELTLFWRSKARMEQDYSAVVALLNAQEQIVSQSDGHVPGYPTSAWRSGADTLDRRVLQLPGHLEAGIYTLGVGWYTPSAPDERLSTQSTSTTVAHNLLRIPVTLRRPPMGGS